MAGECVSSTGTWMQMMAQGLVMTTLTHSAFMLGMVNLASGLPQTALTMLGGSLADRHDKRLILAAAQVVQIGLAALMGWLILTRQLQIWHVLAIAAVLGVVAAFEVPAASALVPELVEPEEIADAIAVDRSSFHATRMIGPAGAGVLIGAFGPASAFFANAASFVPLIISLLTLNPRPVGSEEEEAQRASGMGEGFAFVRQDKPTLAMIAVMALNTVLVFPCVMVMMPLYATQQLHLDATGYGLMMGASALGSFVGSILLLRVPRERRRAGLAVAVTGILAAMEGLAIANGLWSATAFTILLMLGVSSLFGLTNTTVQERAPAHLRGRVSAIAGLAFFGLMPVAGLGITSVSDHLGMRTTIGAAGVLFFALAGLLLLSLTRVPLHAPRVEMQEPV